MKYLFPEPLIDGVIRERPNRFIMLVEIDGQIHKCHCPTTGKIGNIQCQNIPCLLSVSTDPKRKTTFTVEAIFPEKGVCLGINQTKANAYVAHFLRENALKKLVDVRELKREVKLNGAKIDFLVNSDFFLEVKTPLMHLPFGKQSDPGKFNSFARTGRHYEEVTRRLSEGGRAAVLMCFLYDAPLFKTPPTIRTEIREKIQAALEKGLERWQINLCIDREGVSLDRYFKLDTTETERR